ncbi:MAG: hypothetical protein HYR56_23115 [Acidobacteria bacterium]|nr:hypothetical protein [Acidobacteriota bacterium]MBI3427838.1 hypothetical protein [Acidobacteriota bacterium]
MKPHSFVRRVSHLFLWIIPLPFLGAAYQPGKLPAYLLAGAIQAGLISVAAWMLARGSDNGSGTRASRVTAPRAAAALLIGNWVVTSLALNMDAPPQGQAWLTTLTDQRFRYAALVCGALLCFGGLAILAARLRDACQSVPASLGFASSIISTVVFTLLFLAYPLLATLRYEQEARVGTAPVWWAFVSAFLFSAGLVHRFSAHLSTILFAVAAQKSALMSRGASMGIIGLALLMAVTSIFVHLPPAVTFIPPYLIGVSLLDWTRDPTP